MSERAHHRPSLPGSASFEAIETTDHGADPAILAAAADRAATALVRGARDQADEALVSRVVHLADTEGLETLADLWSGAPADSLAGVLWRLYVLRSWVYADPVTAAREFDRGRTLAPVAEAISGVEEPPGPAEVQALVDAVLGGVVVGDFADTIFRAAAFARVAAAGRALSDEAAGSSYHSDLAAARLLTLAEQLQSAGRLELDGKLA
jgi:hypothetical protein